jgi:hypothetical protein
MISGINAAHTSCDRTRRRDPMNEFSLFQPNKNDVNKSGNSKSRSILYTECVLSAYLIAALIFGLVACSKEKPKAVSTSVAPSPTAAVAATAPVTEQALPPAAPAAKKKAVRKRPEKVTYKNDTYGISFQYPRRYALKTGDEAIVDWFGSQPVGMNFAQPGGVSVAAVELPRGSFPGTDYRDAFFTVAVNRHLSEAQCSQFSMVEEQKPDDESLAPQTVTVGEKQFSETNTFEGKTTEQSYARYYHRFENGVCYEVALGLQTAGYGVVDGLNAVDRDDVFAKLEPILNTVKIDAAEKPENDSSPVAMTPATAQETAQTGAHEVAADQR